MIGSTAPENACLPDTGPDRAASGPSRRTALGLMAAALAVPPLDKAGALAAPPGGLHLVDGWVLTSGDLARLARHDRR